MVPPVSLLWKSIVIGLFVSQKTVKMTFFTDHCAQNFSFNKVSVFATSLTKLYFSVYITHFSVNFTWFALLSHQILNNRPLFKPLWFAAISNSPKTNNLVRWEYFWNFSPYIFTNPSAQAGYDTRSIFFKWSLTGLNSEFSFS